MGSAVFLNSVLRIYVVHNKKVVSNGDASKFLGAVVQNMIYG